MNTKEAAVKMREAASQIRKLASDNDALIQKQASIEAENAELRAKVSVYDKEKTAAELFDAYVETSGISVPKDVFIKRSCAEETVEQMKTKMAMLNDMKSNGVNHTNFGQSKAVTDPTDAFSEGVKAANK